MESVFTFGAEAWVIHEKEGKMTRATEMDVLRKSAVISRMEKRTNTEVREIMKVTNSQDYLESSNNKSLRWFGLVKRMEDNRLPKVLMNWERDNTQRRKRGRPPLSWRRQTKVLMQNRMLTSTMAMRRTTWRAETRNR